MGIWLPHKGKNISLVKEARAMWRRAQALRGRHAVRIEHVRSHTMVPGNELADRLAELGRSLGPLDPDVGVAEAQRAMTTIALAANTRDQQRHQAANHNQQPQQPQPNQPFIIYQTNQPPDANSMIRDDG